MYLQKSAVMFKVLNSVPAVTLVIRVTGGTGMDTLNITNVDISSLLKWPSLKGENVRLTVTVMLTAAVIYSL